MDCCVHNLAVTCSLTTMDMLLSEDKKNTRVFCMVRVKFTRSTRTGVMSRNFTSVEGVRGKATDWKVKTHWESKVGGGASCLECQHTRGSGRIAVSSRVSLGSEGRSCLKERNNML